MSGDPGLRFWLHYAARQGAIYEEEGDEALVVLPRAAQEAFGLAEEIAVTADPEVAQEDGALLLMPGHPLLEQAAKDVLDQGDVGYTYAAWPAKAPPTPAHLLERAREQFPVDHGRIDEAQPEGAPLSVYVPALRLAALVTYTVDDRFQERVEVLVDARTGIALAEAVRLSPLAVADRGHPALAPDLPLALEAVHALVEQQAIAREAELARQVQTTLRDELERVNGYYAAALESIVRRRAAALPERQALLDAQAEATRGEQARRITEIEEKFRPRHSVQPFRLHLVLLPALLFLVDFRRGERRYPLALTWLLHQAAFAAIRCPHCGSPEPLVAGRNFLGCRHCLARPVATPAPTTRPPDAEDTGRYTSQEAAPKPSPALLPGRRAEQAAAAAQPAMTAARAATAPGKAAPVPPPAVVQALHLPDVHDQQRAQRLGEELPVSFWQSALAGTAWPQRRLVPDSPLGTIYRLYGASGPLFAVGLAPTARPEQLTMRTAPLDTQFDTQTGGHLRVGETGFPYTLRWRLVANQPMLFEALPYTQILGNRLPPPYALQAQAAGRVFTNVPRPRLALGPVGTALWERDLAALGLPVLVRCLTAWWRVEGRPGLAPFGPDVLAAALVHLVGPIAGLRRTRTATAAVYSVAPLEVSRAARELETLLQLSELHAW
jgi:hypothetical protein